MGKIDWNVIKLGRGVCFPNNPYIVDILDDVDVDFDSCYVLMLFDLDDFRAVILV